MKWHVVVAAMKSALEDDATLIEILGGAAVEPEESGVKRKIPSVRYTVISDVEEEVMNPVLVQIDIRARDREQGVEMEGAVRRRLTQQKLVDGCRTEFVIGRDGDDPQPGVVHRSLDFRFLPVRSR